MVPGDIEQGADFSILQDKFPKQCRDIYQESLENLIPVTEKIRKNNKNGPEQKENSKIIPVNELQENKDSTKIKREAITTEGNLNNTPRTGMTNAQISSQDSSDFRAKKSRNRTRYDLTKPIIEHEEEAKGTIDFKNRNQLREESKSRAFASYKENYRDPLNESDQPFLRNEVNEEFKMIREGNDSIENAIRMISQADNQHMKAIQSVENRSSDEEEKKMPSKRGSEGLRVRKRSISAQEPTRTQNQEESRSARIDVSLKNNLQSKRGTAFERPFNAEPLIIENQQEIEELINDFSQDLERREEAD